MKLIRQELEQSANIIFYVADNYMSLYVVEDRQITSYVKFTVHNKSSCFPSGCLYMAYIEQKIKFINEAYETN